MSWPEWAALAAGAAVGQFAGALAAAALRAALARRGRILAAQAAFRAPQVVAPHWDR